MRIILGMIMTVAALLFSGCEKNLEEETFNVMYYYPSGEEKYLGQSTGLSECSSIAHDFARSKNIDSSDVNYVCCLQDGDTFCKEKHR